MSNTSFALPIRQAAATNAVDSLVTAAANGNIDLVRQQLDRGTPINAKNSGQWTALHRAVQQGHEQVVRLLISRGADVCVKGSPMGLQPLHLAISVWDCNMVRLLLANGAAREIEAAPTGGTPLHLAISTGSRDMIDTLIEYGADVHATVQGQYGSGETGLHMAVASWNHKLVPFLVSKGLDVNAKGLRPAGQTPLHIAAGYGYDLAVATLLDAGADINTAYEDGRTALHCAANLGHLATVELLVDRGADIMASTSSKFTPLCAAAANGISKVMDYLVSKSTGIITHEQQARVVISAAAADKTDSVALLLRKGYPIDGRYEGLTALELASAYGIENMVIFLLRKWPYPPGSPHHQLAIQLATAKAQYRIVGFLNATIPLPDPAQQRAGGPIDAVDGDSVAWSIALDMTMHSRRRIIANPKLGGLPPIKCDICLDLNFRRGCPEDVEVMQFTSKSVAIGTSRGCPSCTMIYRCIKHLTSVYGQPLAEWTQVNKPCQLHSMVEGGPLYVSLNKSGLVVEIYSHAGYPTAYPTVGVAREIPTESWSAYRKNNIRALLKDCLTEHSECSYRSSKLPTRVIDVGTQPTDEPRLHVSKGDEISSYTTLSHCWGGSSPMTTEKNTLKARTKRIRLDELPKTFRDAVIITRELGIRYLWIDSLCIIQDDAEDWAREALKMSTVYANCQVMIAAISAADCHGGCFPVVVDRPERKTFSIEADGPVGRKSRVFFRLSNFLNDDLGEVCHTIYDPTSLFKPKPLDTRGWTLQERLSPRVLHFGTSEIGWECASKRACECQVVATELDASSRFKSKFTRVNRPTEDSAATGSIQQVLQKRWRWGEVVDEFTRRNLTKSSDLLPALSGLAEAMSPGSQNDYACGLWKNNLAVSLMWQPLGSSPRRHNQYYAPSWSWASLISPIKTAKTSNWFTAYEKHGWKTPYVIGDDDEPIEDHSKAKVQLLKVLDIRIVTAGSNPFGPPRSASLIVRGSVAAVWCEELTDAAKANHGAGSVKSRLLVSSAGGASPAQTTCTLDLPNDYSEVSIGEQLLLLFISESATSEEGYRTTPDGMMELKDRRGGAQGLVLQFVIGEGEESYRRVGTFSYLGTDIWQRWKTLREERTLVLI